MYVVSLACQMFVAGFQLERNLDPRFPPSCHQPGLQLLSTWHGMTLQIALFFKV